LTLNEANPDANLYTIVDKTDLITNSTEFCFTPMGIFEIESEGLVVRTQNDRDLFVSKQGSIWAREKAVCIAKVYDVHRESSQAEFHGPGDTVPPAKGDVALINGPEPDVRPLPQECRWGGWLQLPTSGDSTGQGRSLKGE